MTDGVDQTARDGVVRAEREIRERLRIETYRAEQAGLIARIVELEKDNIALEAKVDKAQEKQDASRRLLLASFVLPLLLALILLYVQSQIGAG